MRPPPVNPVGSASPFWDHAVRLYAQPGVEALCLELQDEHGVDVLLLLLALWLTATGHVVDEPLGERLQAAANWWRGEVVAPLRRARRNLRQLAGPDREGCITPEEVRRAVARVELDAERLAMEALEELAAGAALLPATPKDLFLINCAALGLENLPLQPFLELLD